MRDMNTPSRTRRAFWSDTRFLIGILLVASSIAGVWFVVTSSRETTAVLQTSRTIVRGEVVTSADFRAVEVGLGAAEPGYLTPELLVPGSVAARTITAGELVPASALIPSGAARTTVVVISSAVGVPDSLARGATVELWAAAPLAETRGFEPPRLLLRTATVAAVSGPQGLIASSGATLELVIDRIDVPVVLAALSDGSILSVIPLGGGW